LPPLAAPIKVISPPGKSAVIVDNDLKEYEDQVAQAIAVQHASSGHVHGVEHDAGVLHGATVATSVVSPLTAEPSVLQAQSALLASPSQDHPTGMRPL